MRIAKTSIPIVLLLLATSATAATALDFWHSYTHRQKDETHYGFHLSHKKRGLFWGPCGPATKSQQWFYNFDLAGEGPVYTSGQLELSDDNGKALHVVSGQVVTDLKRWIAEINIEVESAGVTNKFVGNGKHRIHQIK